MFETISQAPADPILGLTDAFNRDPRPNKINLGVGIYKDDNGKTPTLSAVRKAEQLLAAREQSKTYLAIEGSVEYGRAVQALVFGADGVGAEGRLRTAQCPGGTGALRVAGDFLKQVFGSVRLWVSRPTWANHQGIFIAAGLEVKEYAYYEPKTQSLDFAGMQASLEQAARGDVVLLHGCCHNPTGIDPSPEQWQALSDLCQRRGLLPLFDLAYQGLGDGLERDAEGVRLFLRTGQELLVASSFSKSFGLYNQRVGALTLVTANREASESAFSRVRLAIRSNYSNPPAHGGALVTTVLGDEALAAEWRTELAQMRERIATMRVQFVQKLAALGVRRDFSFIAQQRGMFSFAGLSPAEVELLRERHAIFAVGSGRINVAGITSSNIDPLCQAIADVLATS